MCFSVRRAILNEMVFSLVTKGVSAMRRPSEYYTTPEQFQRNLAMPKGFFKQQHAMQHAMQNAGVNPYAAVEQHYGMPPSMLNAYMPPAGVKANYEHDADYVPGEGSYTAPGEMPAGSPAGLTRLQLVEVSEADRGSAQVCINGKYYRGAKQPAGGQQSSAEGGAAQS